MRGLGFCFWYLRDNIVEYNSDLCLYLCPYQLASEIFYDLKTWKLCSLGFMEIQ